MREMIRRLPAVLAVGVNATDSQNCVPIGRDNQIAVIQILQEIIDLRCALSDNLRCVRVMLCEQNIAPTIAGLMKNDELVSAGHRAFAKMAHDQTGTSSAAI